eukprot:5840350-Lingulodinium_polyedra.AAC.1
MAPSRRFGQVQRTSKGKSTSRHRVPGMTPLKTSTACLAAIGLPFAKNWRRSLRRLDALF